MDVQDLRDYGVTVEATQEECCTGCHYNRTYTRGDRPVTCQVIARLRLALETGAPAPDEIDVQDDPQESFLPEVQFALMIVCSRFLAKERVVRRRPRPRPRKELPGQLALFG